MSAAVLMTWVWLFLLLTVRHASSESFSLAGPKSPVSGVLGASVSLPCSLSNNLNAAQLEVRWYRPTMYNKPVLYRNQQAEESSADEQYRGRVSLPGGLEKGDVSLKLDHVTLKDEGDYICHVSSDSWYDKINITLKTQAVGCVPILSVADAGGGQMKFTCQSHGWHPKPSVTWRDRDGNDLKHLSEDTFTKDSEGLVNVSSWLLVSLSESDWLSCSVGLSEFDQERKESRAMAHTPTESWKRAFIITFIIILLLIIGLAVFLMLHRKGLICPKKKKREDTEETQPLNFTEEKQKQNEALAEDPLLLSEIKVNHDQNPELRVNFSPAEEVNHQNTEPRVNISTTAEIQPLNFTEEKQKQNEALAEDPLLLSEIKVNHDQNPELRLNFSPAEEVNHQNTEPRVNISTTAETESISSSVVKEDTQKQKKPSEESSDQQNINKDPPVQSSAGPEILNSSPVKKDKQKTVQPDQQSSNTTDQENHNLHTDQQPQTDQQKTAQSDQNPSNATDQVDHSLHTDQHPVTSAEWEQVEQFKENITIDPEETPKFFRLALGGNRVNCPRPVENHEEEKFKIFTLCKEKFSSGKHYWEMKMCEKPKQKLSWFVGVASEEAERVHRIPFTPQNGFWVLCYEKEKGFYTSQLSTPLTCVSDKLTTVGVFLDCDQHTLSFYDVDTKSMIYTFTGVTDKKTLRPLISPGIRDKKVVHICLIEQSPGLQPSISSSK